LAPIKIYNISVGAKSFFVRILCPTGGGGILETIFIVDGPSSSSQFSSFLSAAITQQ
jgi:hypothetical protein